MTEVRFLSKKIDSKKRGIELCTFSYNGCNYCIISDNNGDLMPVRIRQSLWNGNYHDDSYISGRIYEISNFIIQSSNNNKNDYPLSGEHYAVENYNNSYKIRKTKKPKTLVLYNKLIPFITHLITALTLSLIYGYICVNTFRISIAANVFPDLSRKQLIISIYFIQLFGSLILFSIKRFQDNILALCINSILPYNLIAIIAAFRGDLYVKIATITVFSAFLVFKVIPRLYRPIKENNKARIKRQLKIIRHGCYCLLIISVIISCIAVRFFGVSFYSFSSNPSENYMTQPEKSFNEIKGNLKSTKWSELDLQKKLDYLQIICNYESEKLGCESPKILSGYPNFDGVYGNYNHKNNTIMVNIDHLKNDTSEDVIKTLLHEVRHAYQYAVVKSFNKIEKELDTEDLALQQYKEALSFRENTENYVDGIRDYDGYLSQVTEVDSRNWSEDKINNEYRGYIYPSKE